MGYVPAEPADRRADPTTPEAGAEEIGGAEAEPMAEPGAEAEPMAEPGAEAELMAEPGAEAEPTAEPVAEVDASEDEVVESKARSERTPKDLVISLLVILIPIALVLGFYRVFLGADQPAVVDPGPAFAQARTANAFPVREPAGLGGGWRPISANFTRADGGAILRVGYVTPEGAGVQLVQSNMPGETAVPAELSTSAQPQGLLQLSGGTWQRYVAGVDQRGLVLLAPGQTVIVFGDAAERELRDLAAALR
jgi:hypothetical protein